MVESWGGSIVVVCAEFMSCWFDVLATVLASRISRFSRGFDVACGVWLYSPSAIIAILEVDTKLVNQ